MALSLRQALRSAMINTVLLGERWRSGVAYNPLSAQMAQNPYPSYANLRARDPVHRSRLMNAWVFTRYADVDAILRDYRNFSNDPRNGELSRRRRASLPAPDDYTMLFLDPPDHTRLRGLVNKAFTPRAINALEPHIRSLVESLLDQIGDPASFDLIEVLAHPLPVIVIAEMLGVPPEDRAQFRVWSNRRARLLEPTISDREREVASAAAEALDAYFRPIIKERRAAPQDDIVSALAHVEEQGDTLTEREMLTMLRPAAGRGQRDHHQSDRQRPAGLAAAPGSVCEAQGRSEHDPSSGGGAVAFRLTCADRFSLRTRGLRGERLSGATRPEHRPAARRGQPRPGGVRGSGPARYRPPRGQPPLVRARHPPLSRRPLSTPGRPDRP